MDKRVKQTFSWLPAQMPQVAQLMKDRRAAVGDEWVDLCWRRGVLGCEPGWFYAAEGALAVGTLWDDARIVALYAQAQSRDRAVLVLRPVEESKDGAACS